MKFTTHRNKLGTAKLMIAVVGFCVIAFLSSCSSSENLSNRNVAGIYLPGINLLEPEYKVFHENDSLTKVYFRLHSENLLYTRRRTDSVFTANVQVKYELLGEGEKLIDSATIYFVDYGQNNQKKFLEGIVELKTELNTNYDLLISFYDANRDNYLKKKLAINRGTIHNSQNFLATDTLGGIIYKNYLGLNEGVVIQKSWSNPSNDITLKYFFVNQPIAKPPFSETEKVENVVLKPDSFTVLEFDSTRKVRFDIPAKGLYFLQTSEGLNEGPTFFSFQNNFPEVKDVENMIEPMRYITTREEYNTLLEAENKKLAMDEFWLETAGGTERARTLIKEYFNRVESANLYFTSYLEGWKSDRGLIYIIYGPPNVVYKNKDYENWIYGEENNITSMNFVFYKVKNYLTHNDYSLSRSGIYKSMWYRAVDTWRSGRVF
ncbi:MAG: GWxTD domain-containing protein [Flavobacteriales bacterium]|nr:GWxTD domain-containing protein [Flavobacteriales bacterium]MCB9175419.1 GWxTD domain-containing protein [Flavobacteriales bacterium]